MASKFLKESASLVRSYGNGATGILNKFLKSGVDKGHVPKPRLIKALPDELQFEIPSSAENKADIKMVVDENNRFILTAENNEKGIYLVQHLDLPREWNFEKANFKAKWQPEKVNVTVTNFQREEFVVGF